MLHTHRAGSVAAAPSKAPQLLPAPSRHPLLLSVPPPAPALNKPQRDQNATKPWWAGPASLLTETERQRFMTNLFLPLTDRQTRVQRLAARVGSGREYRAFSGETYFNLRSCEIEVPAIGTNPHLVRGREGGSGRIWKRRITLNVCQHLLRSEFH